MPDDLSQFRPLQQLIQMRTTNSAAVHESNCFDFLRLSAALAVIFSHSFPLVGLPEPAPVAGQTFGSLAVALFFAMSGFLVCQSWSRDPSVSRFAQRRLLRIAPGLLVVTLLTALALGPALTSLALVKYLSRAETWAYIPITGLTLNVPPLPGLFENNPFPNSNNGSLWTLRYEVLMYAVLAISGMATPRRLLRAVCLTLLCSFALVWLALVALDLTPYQLPFVWRLGTEVYLDKLSNLGVYFFAGCCLHLFRERIPLSVPLSGLLCLACALAPNAAAATVLLWVAVPYTAIAVAYKGPQVLRRFNGFDWSYGTYIYAFPVQQAFSHFFGRTHASWVTCLVGSTAVTLLLAALSWHIVERPALKMKPSRHSRMSTQR